MRPSLAILGAALLAACPGPASSSDGGSGGSDAGSLTVLELRGISPDHGPLAGGTFVTVTGAGFAPGLGISIGGAPASTVTYGTVSEASALTPPGVKSGAADVTVTLGGQSATLPGGFSYDPPPPIGWCNLKYPTSLTLAAGATSPEIYGRVYVKGVTDSQGNPASIRGEVGVGPAGSQPGAGWTWAPAAYNPTCTACGNNFEYDGTFTAPAVAGAYAFATRFSSDQGQSWTACDSQGDQTFSPANAGALDVGPADGGSGDGGPSDGGSTGPSVGWCILQSPKSLALTPGAPSGLVYGRVYVAGITPSGDAGEILAQVGYGPTDSVPGASWSWAPATHNASCAGCANNDEFQGSFTAPGLGSYGLAYRFSVSGGASWTPCDAQGDMPYALANQGTLEVAAPDAGPPDAGPPDAGLTFSCGLITTSASAEPGAASPLLSAQVYAAGLTEVAGNQGDFTVELGVGPTGSQPGSGWSWSSPAAFNASCTDCSGGHNYEYLASVTGPAAAGSYALAARASIDQGAHWQECDGAWDPVYDPAKAGVLTDAFRLPAWCDLQYPPALTASAGAPDAGPVYGQVWQPGVTDVGGDAGLVLAEVGVGPPGGDPTQDGGFAWSPLSFNPSCTDSSCYGHGGNNYEYFGTFVAPADAGSYEYVTRFSVDQGRAWQVCGEANPWSPDGGSDAGVLTVR